MLPIYLAELDTQEEKDKFAELYEKYSAKNVSYCVGDPEESC